MILQVLRTIAAASLDPNSYQTDLPQVTAEHTQLHDILQIVIGIVAAVSVLFIVVSGLRFVLSAGDPQETAKARNTIVYALVGLVVAVAAEAIVTFVVDRL